MTSEKNIVAIGGGGFGRTTKDLRIEKYILNLSEKEKPNIVLYLLLLAIMTHTKLIFMMFLQNSIVIQLI